MSRLSTLTGASLQMFRAQFIWECVQKTSFFYDKHKLLNTFAFISTNPIFSPQKLNKKTFFGLKILFDFVILLHKSLFSLQKITKIGLTLFRIQKSAVKWCFWAKTGQSGVAQKTGCNVWFRELATLLTSYKVGFT